MNIDEIFEGMDEEDVYDLDDAIDSLEVQPLDVLDFDRVRELTPLEQAFVRRVYRIFVGNSRNQKDRARQNLLAYGVLNRRDAIERRRKLALLADAPD